MEPVDINSKELQELKSEFNDLKETLNKQRIVNKELLEQIRKQKTSFIGKDLTKRMSTDIITIPMIIVICHAVGWPVWFAVAVSIWALIDLIAVLVGRKKFDTQKMLDDDVLTAAKTVKEYKRFYHLSVGNPGRGPCRFCAHPNLHAIGLRWQYDVSYGHFYLCFFGWHFAVCQNV